jgi:hypothetical protein
MADGSRRLVIARHARSGRPGGEVPDAQRRLSARGPGTCSRPPAGCRAGFDTNDCIVLTGTLHDPYTGTTIAFQRGQDTSDDVQIDHVLSVPVAAETH